MLRHETIFLIVGKSGSGKSSLCEKLEEHYGMKQIQSYTTRPRRHANEKGHIFVASKKMWDALNPHETMVAYTKFNGHDYWATSWQVEDSDLYVIDPDGVEYFKDKYTGTKNIDVIYIKSSIRERFCRMYRRGDSWWQIVSRLVHDLKAFWGFENKANFAVTNTDLDTAFQALRHHVYVVDGVKSCSGYTPCECEGSIVCLTCEDGSDDDGAIYCGRNANGCH